MFSKSFSEVTSSFAYLLAGIRVMVATVISDRSRVNYNNVVAVFVP